MSIIEKAIDEELLDLVKQLIALEDHLSDDAVRFGDIQYQKDKDNVRGIRKVLMRKLLHAPDQPPSIEIRRKLANLECVTWDTLTYTKTSILPMCFIKENHCSVLTHRGTYNNSIATKRQYDGPIYKITFYYTNIPLRITPEHPIYGMREVREKQTEWRKSFSGKQLEWIPAKEVTERDFIAFPRISKVKDIDIITHKMARLIGWYLSEGCCCGGNSVYISFGKHEKEYISETAKLIEDIFGKSYIHEKKTQVSVTFHNKHMVPFFEQFGCGARKKRFPEWYLYLPKIKQWETLRNIIRGDGYIIDKHSINISTTSEILAGQIRLILFRLGILHSFKKQILKESCIDGRIIKSNGFIYVVTISGDAAREVARHTGLKYNGGERTAGNFGWVGKKYVMLPVRSIEKEQYKGNMYNLHVNPAESYTTVHGILHNCEIKHLSLSFVILTEICDLLSRADRDKEVVELLEYAKNLNSMLHIYIGKAREILEG